MQAVLFCAALLLALAPHVPDRAPERISIRGNRFFVGDRPIFLNGVNTPWNRWNEFGGDYDPEWWEAEFGRLRDARVNCVRVWIHCNGRVSPVTSADGVVSGVPESFWGQTDHLFEQATASRIYLMPALWSFDFTRRAERYKKLLADPDKVQSYIDTVLAPLVERYDKHPWLLGWEICNEPEWMFENAGVETSHVIRMHAMLAAAVHRRSSAYVTTGAACVKWNSDAEGCEGNHWSNEILRAHHPDGDPRAFFDFYQVHYYPWQDQWFGTPFEKTVEAYGMPDDRPIIIGEMPAKGGSARHVQLHENGFDGGFGWTSNGIDRNGRLADLQPALLEFHARYPELVYPSGDGAGVD
jgi:hypothetical protein